MLFKRISPVSKMKGNKDVFKMQFISLVKQGFLSCPSTPLHFLRRVEGRVSSVLFKDHDEISEKVQKSV
jgi:hypothetical protein